MTINLIRYHLNMGKNYKFRLHLCHVLKDFNKKINKRQLT